jgi:hypothetical protein
VVAILVAVTSLQISLSNFCFTNLRRNERFAFAAASLLCLMGVFGHNVPFLYSLLWAGIPLFLVSIARQFLVRRQLKAASANP